METDNGAEFPESLTEWEQIDSPFPLTRHPPSQQSMSPSAINDNQIPPTIPLEPNSPSSSSSSSSPTPPPSSSSTTLRPEEEARRSLPPPRSDSRLVLVKEIANQLRLRFGILSREVLGAAYKVCNYKLIAGKFWSIASVAGVVAAVLLSLLYARLRRWRPRALRRGDDNGRLLLLLRERDEKISQLLFQIAEMNEALSARRRVPVIRVG
ncbi:hypothetical protein PanWU01x14_197210 [Parasponia andersonii]|uniref:Transmembrane protein n=1 Tax=Parasponia andersonii TaxID=3476 RepID=A0A2P5BZD1_PARAD|nr:hypothetical protein PanWU01x14_197210 [Parasponia andersonii]